MKADGTILIDTKIVDGGMEKGFELIKDEMASVGITAKKVGEKIQVSFSKMDVSKPIANAVTKVEMLERQLAAATSDFESAIAADDDKGASRMAARRIAVYDRLEEARERLATEIASAVQKEAEAEARASQKKIREAEKEAEAKRKISEKQFRDMTKPARRFNSRLREIVTGALFFNALSAGLRNVTSYFGSALRASDEYSNSLDALRGSLMTAFQPIYESVLPAIVSLINWLNVAAQVIGKFFAAITGKNYSQMQRNAKALNNQAGAIGNVGDAAEKASKQLAGFDEINRLESIKNANSGAGGGGGRPIFEELGMPSEWETAIESLAMRVKDIFFKWDNLNPEIIAEKLVTALSIIAGGLIGFALGGPQGALIGMTIGAGIGVAISSIIFDGDGKLSGEELLSALTTVLFGLGGGLIGFAVGGPAGAAIGMTIGAVLGIKLSTITFNGDGKLSSEEIIKSLVAGISFLAGGIIGFAIGGPGGAAVGAVVGLALGFSIQAIEFEGVEATIKSMLDSVREYFSTTFSDGFIHGLATMIEDAVALLWNFFVEFVNSVIENWNDIWASISSYQTTGTIPSATGYSVGPRSVAPDVPQLAKGAVIPPNRKFMAVLGDQTHGNNLETPESLLRQIVREESGGDERLAQLLETLISTVEGIQVGDETIGRAAARYNRSTSRARGY